MAIASSGPHGATPESTDREWSESDPLPAISGVGSVLARAEVALTKLQVVSVVSLLPELQVGSAHGEVGLYGDFSPHATSCPSPLCVVSIASESEVVVEVAALVLQIMPELQNLPLSMKHMEVNLLVTSCERHDSPLSCEQSEAPKSIMSVVPVAVDVEAISMLAPAPLEPSQPLAFVDYGGFYVAFTHSHVTIGQVVSVREKVDEILF